MINHQEYRNQRNRLRDHYKASIMRIWVKFKDDVPLRERLLREKDEWFSLATDQLILDVIGDVTEGGEAIVWIRERANLQHDQRSIVTGGSGE